MNDAFIIESFTPQTRYTPGLSALGQLQVSEGPAEIQFVGQSPASNLASPIGTSFIQGTGEAAADTSDSSTLLIVLAVGVAGWLLFGKKKWK